MTEIQENDLLTHLIKHSKLIGELQSSNKSISSIVLDVQDKLSDYNGKLGVNNELLAEHIKGVQTNSARLDEERKARKECHEQNQLRISKLEESPNFWKRARSLLAQTATTLTALGALSGVMYKVAQFAGWIP